MRRSKQQLSDEESVAILHSAIRGFLSVIGDDGYPYAIPINFVYDDGNIFFHCAREGHKLDAIRACDKACFTVTDTPEKEPGEWWYHVRSVVCFGRVHVIDDEGERLCRLRQLGRKYFPEGYDLESEISHSGPNAVVLKFEIEHFTGKRVKEK